MKSFLYAFVGATLIVVPSFSGLAAMPAVAPAISGNTYILPKLPEIAAPQKVLGVVKIKPAVKLELPTQPSLSTRIRSLQLATTKA